MRRWRQGHYFTITSLPSGTYRLAAYAHSLATGTFNQARTVTVTIQ